jgi:MFS family permease
MISPFSANRFGLKFNLYTFTFFILLAIIIEIVAKNWWHFLFAKIVGGFAAGFIGTSIMSYISEITMPKMRGAHLSAFAFFFALGQVASAIALEVLEQTAPWEFRRAFYSEFAIFGVWLPILILLPESPAWYYKKGKHEAAKKSLRRLIGNVPDYDWDREYAVMAQEIDDSHVLVEKSSQYGLVACFKGTNLRRTLVSTIPFSMQVSSGMPMVD